MDYISIEGKSNEKFPKVRNDISECVESEESKALKIILGIESPSTTNYRLKSKNESSLIKIAREFRAEFENMSKK